MRLDIVKTRLQEQWNQSAADPARREAIAPGIENRASHYAFSGVDRERLPVVVECDQYSARSQHTGHLADGGAGIGDVLEHPIDAAAVESRIVVRQLSRVGEVERQARDITVALMRRVDHRLAPVDRDNRPARCDAPRQCRGVVAEPTTDLEDPAARCGSEQVVALALALGEERDRVDQRQTSGEHLEIGGLVDTLESRGEVVGHVILLR